MAFFKKLLFCFNSRTSIKYGVYALLCLYFFATVQLLSIRYDLGYTLFSYNGAKSSDSEHKYILVWDSSHYTANNKKEQIFPKLKCPVKNCIFTEDKYLFDGGYTRFNALLFTEQLLKRSDISLPAQRSEAQIYIFTALESSHNYPACEVNYDNFFNWTLTYRLDSDVKWPFFFVRNVARDVIAPSEYVQWQVYNKSIPIPTYIEHILHHRKKVAAWLVSNCWAENSRNDYLMSLQEHLYHFSLKIDVYGGCSKVKCTYDNCETMLRKDYYFYMAFENSFSEDYVTEKVLHGYNNYVVPIVYGGANYTRFLPPGSYINAREIHPYNLAYIMYQAVKNRAKYYEFFEWTNYYTVDSLQDLPDYHPLCDLCEALNRNIENLQTYKLFRLWWNGRSRLQWCMPQEYWNKTSPLYVNGLPFLETY